MAPRSGNRSRHYDDPYTFDDPYIRSPPADKDVASSPAYEYVGTDEPVSPRWGTPVQQPYSPPDQERRRRPSPHRRYSRTTSPPRRSRHDRALTPPPQASRHASSPRHGDPIHHRDSKKAPKDKHHHRYQNITQNPNLQRYGKKGFTFLSEAAAAYAAAQAGEEPPEPHSAPFIAHEDMRDDRPSRHRRRYTPSPSPSPPRRRHSTRHGDRDRDRNREYDERDRDQDRSRRRRSVADASPPPLSRDPDSYVASRRSSGRDRDRERDRSRDRDRSSDRSRARSHRRSRHSPSPAPSSRSGRRGRSTPSSSGFRDGLRGQMAMPPSANAQRWQMAARAALEAGGLTAIRLRKEPGNWAGDKAAKVATAALGAAAIDAFIDQDPRQTRSGGRGMKGIAESALSGFIANQIMGHQGSSKRGKSRF
ncbi:hypothetical protein F5Y18DRAFT_358373 [Xylariaceae sp. FL1019]|nr:hypothetical protein F5Y18DRAFT_358373 [Xylariaceae sp. FL1019]